METYICNECGVSILCISNDPSLSYDGGCPSVWKPTEEYEIRKKDRFTMNEDVKKLRKASRDLLKENHKSKRFLDDFVDRIFDSMELYDPIITTIPNCALCKWNQIELNTDDNSNIHSCDCMAMGGRDAHDCYGTDECRALYGMREN